MTAQLRLSVRDADSGAGQAHQQVILTNRGGRCTLLGYPGLSFVDATGQMLGSSADESPATVRRVTLAPGAAAAAILTASNAHAYPDSACRPQQASRLRVYPPGDRAALLVADPVVVCAATGSKQLHIAPLEAG